jgi:rhodanese-related sulfurtransferase
MADAKPDPDQLAPARLKELLDGGKVELLDVRQEHEWEAGRIPGSRHILLNDLPAEAERLGSEQQIVVYCHGGSRSAMAAEALRSAGFDASSLEGGIDAWDAAKLPLEPADGHVAESGEPAEILRQSGRYAPFPDDAVKMESDTD